jgi:hypothetical protein
MFLLFQVVSFRVFPKSHFPCKQKWFQSPVINKFYQKHQQYKKTDGFWDPNCWVSKYGEPINALYAIRSENKLLAQFDLKAATTFCQVMSEKGQMKVLGYRHMPSKLNE